ncbi:hypothetical protein ACIBHX_01940 [Nonomuraea sp. NPDC050536]|uniref:hypothetical protein n=1 Tax=Nonomuraea sp. NPDC050536 TaxID=3364366 RepID=UPI0037CB3C51
MSQRDDTAKQWQITANNLPLNISSGTVTAVIKRDTSIDDDDPTVIQRSEGSGLTIVDAATGKVEIVIPTSVTQYPSSWFYKIDLEIDGRTETVIDGWIQIADT